MIAFCRLLTRLFTDISNKLMPKPLQPNHEI